MTAIGMGAITVETGLVSQTVPLAEVHMVPERPRCGVLELETGTVLLVEQGQVAWDRPLAWLRLPGSTFTFDTFTSSHVAATCDGKLWIWEWNATSMIWNRWEMLLPGEQEARRLKWLVGRMLEVTLADGKTYNVWRETRWWTGSVYWKIESRV